MTDTLTVPELAEDFRAKWGKYASISPDTLRRRSAFYTGLSANESDPRLQREHAGAASDLLRCARLLDELRKAGGTL